jgi:predicted ribosome quality control (RQC) complex YloA/Tae2 family protein
VPDAYDVLTIAAVVDELDATIVDGRIQRIGLIDPRTIGAEIYANGRRHYLIASADDQLPRFRLAPDMPSLDTALVTPFGLLLRKYARGGMILGIDQPPLERLARISIAKRLPPLKSRADDVSSGADAHLEPVDQDNDDDDEEVESSEVRHFSLYVELMGRRSNLILVDDAGLILESAKRVTPAMSRVRTILPRQPYLPPPAPDRRDPRSITLDDAQALLAGLPPEADAARAIVSTYRGISPTMAREIAFRVTGKSDARGVDIEVGAAESFIEQMRALLAPLQTSHWSPRVYREHDDGECVTYSAIPMTHLAGAYDEVSIESISAAAALAEASGAQARPLRHAQRRERLLRAVNTARERAERRLVALEAEAERASAAERLKRAGELIYAYLWQIAPGQTALEAEGETIALDPQHSPSENAQAYFERYRKAQSAGKQLPELSEESRIEMAYLDQLATLIAQAPGFDELEALAAEWEERQPQAGTARPRRPRAPRRPPPLHDDAGNNVFIGRSGPQNDLLTFEIAGPDDTWLHARGVPGSHVIIRWRNPGAPDDPRTVEAAAALAAWYSAARESGAVEVDVTQRRHVRKIKGAGPGMVTYRNERTVRVRPAAEEQLRDVLR